MKRRLVTILPKGSKVAIARAFDVAIDALEGREICPIPSARPRLALKLKRMRRILFDAHVIWR